MPTACGSASRIEQEDLHFRDHVQFYEYYHGETGRGLGAAHQTGWSGLVAVLIQQCAIGPAQGLATPDGLG